MSAFKNVEGMSQTKQCILRLLKERGKVTATELSKSLGISRVAVHHHLGWLKEGNWVTAQIKRQRRGRPAEMIFLTEQAKEKFFPRRYDLLASVMLDEVSTKFGREFVHKIFCRYQQHLLEKFEKKHVALPTKVKMLVKFLNEEGYLARFEETKDHFVITLPNCPIAKIAKQFQEACESELEVLRKVFDTSVKRQCHLIIGDHLCSYFIFKPRRKNGKRKLKRITTKPNEEVKSQ